MRHDRLPSLSQGLSELEHKRDQQIHKTVSRRLVVSAKVLPAGFTFLSLALPRALLSTQEPGHRQGPVPSPVRYRVIDL